MTDRDKFNLLARMLREQHGSIDHMDDNQLVDYIELMHSFFKTQDPILAESAIATMALIVRNAEANKKVAEQIAKNLIGTLAVPVISEVTGVDIEMVQGFRREYEKEEFSK